MKNPQENSLLYATRSSSSSTHCWIGLNDISSEGTFVWSDGSDALYRNWKVGEPNNHGSEDCVYYRENRNWNDLSCTRTRTCLFCSTNGKNLVMMVVTHY